jgi:phosphoglucosamine mutase
MIEAALEAGFAAAGVDVMLTGPLPTPGIAYLTRALRVSAGVVISASHNPYDDNGIKFFSADGFKLPDAVENEIEQGLSRPVGCRPSRELGRARRIDDAAGRYIEFCKSSFPNELDLHGMKIVVDCANGAAYQVAPSAIWELGAEVIAVGVSPDGTNINDKCGSTHLDLVKESVVASGADIGIALDGDADRLIVVDEKGQTVDGDQIMALIGSQLAARGELRGGGVVATVMSNLGLERFLDGKGLSLVRAKVGDR